MESSPSYTASELTPDLLEDYLGFFDRDAFADHPEWASCYCRLHHFPHETRSWRESTATENRAAVIDLIRDGTMRGYLAYHGERPVAWCNAGPRTRMTTVPEYEEPEADRIGSIMCFVVAKEHRRKGVARRLLDAACTGLAAQGFAIAEGYPLKDVAGEAANHCGPLDLYLSAGFERYREDEDAIANDAGITEQRLDLAAPLACDLDGVESVEDLRPGCHRLLSSSIDRADASPGDAPGGSGGQATTVRPSLAWEDGPDSL